MTDPQTKQERRFLLAAAELEQLGVEVLPAPPNRDHVAFQFADWNNGQVFADMKGRHIREEFIDGHFVNPMGYRQDVHEVLRKHRLVTDWWDDDTIDVYRDPQAPGWAHGYRIYIREYDEQSRSVVVRLPTDERAAILVGEFLEDEGIEAFTWDGRDPAFKELSLHDRVQALETTPLPPRPIRLAILVQLIGSAVANEHDLSKADDEFYKLTWVDHGGMR